MTDEKTKTKESRPQSANNPLARKKSNGIKHDNKVRSNLLTPEDREKLNKLTKNKALNLMNSPFKNEMREFFFNDKAITTKNLFSEIKETKTKTRLPKIQSSITTFGNKRKTIKLGIIDANKAANNENIKDKINISDNQRKKLEINCGGITNKQHINGIILEETFREKEKLSNIRKNPFLTNKNDTKSEKISDTNIKQTKSKNTTFNKNKKTKSKNKLLIEEETKKENDEQKININDKLIITLGEELPFNIKFIPDKLGRFKASIVFQLEDGISFDIDVLANVIGPELSINTPLIDFGLFATGTIQKKEIEIENLSPIKAQYLIRESRYKNINLDNFQTSGYVEEFEGILDEEKDKIKREKIQSLIEYDNSNMKNLDIMKLDSYIMKYSSVHGELEPFEKKTITVSFLSPYPVRIEKELNTIEIITKYCPKKNYINFSAQCEEA